MRLDSADRRFLAVCLMLLAAAVWFSAAYFRRAFPEASIDFRVTREEAGGIARSYLAMLGHGVTGYREAARFGYDEDAKTFLERELGLEAANRLMGARVRLWHWSWRWFRPAQKEEFRVSVTPRGEPVAFQHEIPEAAPRPSLPEEKARALAESFLGRRMARAPETLEFVEGSSRARPARTDHVFTWKERDFDVRGASYRVEVTVLGNEIGGYREYLKAPEAWLRGYERLRSANNAAQSVDTALMLVLVAGMLGVIVLRVRNRDVRWRRAAVVGIIGGLLLFLSSLNAYPLAEYGYSTADSYASFLVAQLVQYLLGALAAGGLLFVLTVGAEPLYREHFGGFVSLGSLATPRGMRTKSFLKGSVLGVALAGLFIAYQIGFYILAGRFGAWSPAEVPYDDMLNTRVPWLFVLFGGFFPAVSEEFLFRMFAVPWLRKVTRSLAAAVVLAGFLWGFGHAAYPQQPFWIRGVEVGLGGVALGWILLRWGIVPCLVWHYSVDALYTALLLLRSHNLYFVLSGAASAAVMAVPALVAFALYLRKGAFEPEDDLLNAREGTAEPRTAAPPPAAGALPYTPLPRARWIVAAALLAAGVCAMLVPLPKLDDKPRFAITPQQARASAGAFLSARGLNPDSFRSVAYPHSAESARLVGKYFLERRPLAWVADAYSRVIPRQFWVVRYYHPLDKEEIRVYVHPETGAVTGFRHDLPEDRPGPSLDAAQARARAEAEARRFDLSTLEIKETSAENQKARRDHTLVWEARAGDARNVEEARFRVRAQVAGDRVTALGAFWKLPETFERERRRHTALSNALVVVRIGAAAGLFMVGLWLLARYTRRHELAWRPVLRTAAALTAVAAAGSLVRLPLGMRDYATAVPLETYRIVLAVGGAMGALGWFLVFAAACGLLSVLRPRSAWTPAAARDALFACAAAVGLTGLATQAGWLARGRFHAQALLEGDVPHSLGSWAPWLAASADAVEETVLALAAAAVAFWIVRAFARKRWLLACAAIAAFAALTSSQVRTPGEFALGFFLAALWGGALWIFARWFARANELAWLLSVWVVAAGWRALALHDGMLAAVMAAGAAVLLLRARTSQAAAQTP